MASQFSQSTTPVEDYDRQLAHRRDAATLRVTNLARLGLVCLPIALTSITVLVSLPMRLSASLVAITWMLTGTLPAAAAAALTLYDWSVLPRRKIVLGLSPWSLLVLGTTLIALGMF